MSKLNRKEMLVVNGGASINGTWINSFVRCVTIFFEIGQSLGTAIRRKMSGSICKV